MPIITRSNSSNRPFPQSHKRSAGFILSGLAVSVVVSSSLFWVMYQLISTAQGAVKVEKRLPGIEIVRLIRHEEPQRKPRKKPEPPEVPQLPKPLVSPAWTEGTGAPKHVFNIPDSSTLTEGIGKGTIGIGEREYMPLTEIQPTYPARALQRGVEGTCVVLYTISASGSVKDVRVDESRCTSTLFHSAAIRAAEKFKYAPRIVDGETKAAHNVTKLFRFSITE